MKKLTALLLALILTISLSIPALAAEDYGILYELSGMIRDYSLEYRDKETEPLLDALAALMEKDPALFGKLKDEMMARLDKYSGYLTEEEYNEAFPRGVSYVGVGITVDPNYPCGAVVESLVEGGSAKENGILPGDVIVSVDGKNIELVPYSEAVPMLRGENGTTVKVQVRRQGKAELIEFKLERRGLSIDNVTYENMGGGVGLIKISRFDSIYDFFAFVDVYNGIPYSDGIKSVIIDLRGNPGGDVAVAYNMLNYMVREKDTVLFELINSEEDEFYTSTGAGVWTPNELLILVDNNTASASEIFAGSLQTLGHARLVGQTTYGKGRSQYHLGLSDNSVAIITAYEILLPGGKTYESDGVVPDYVVEQETVPYALPKMESLDTGRNLYAGSSYSPRVLALQQRLKALGIFPGTPDGKFDNLTKWSVNVFQKAMELPVRTYADAETLKALEKQMEELKKETTQADTQLEFALKLASEAAAKPWVYPPDKIETLN